MSDYQKRKTSLLYASSSKQAADGHLNGGTFCGAGQHFENPELGRQVAMGNASASGYLDALGMNEHSESEGLLHCEVSDKHVREDDVQLFPQLLGTPEWYDARHGDHQSRHDGAPPPPDYYLGYGKKYCLSFSTDLYPKLSNEGQSWLVQARTNLQVAIELEIVKDPLAFDALESDNSAFTSFAYGTHPDAYLDGGLSSLPIADLMQIVAAPDISDLISINGLAQVASLLPDVLLNEGLEFFTEAKGLFSLSGAQEWLFGDDSELEVPGAF